MKQYPRYFGLLSVIIIGLQLAGLILITHHAVSARQESTLSHQLITQVGFLHDVRERRIILESKPRQKVVKAIYLTAYSAGSPKKRAETIDLINRTELNAVVIDTKDASGYVLYDSDVSLVNELDLEDVRIKDLKAVVDEFHDAGIYVMVRQQVMQDPALARKVPDWALKSTYGGLWYNYKGLAWVDPSNQAVWDYNIEIAKETIALGVDEINFDYVRFPSDGNLRTIAYPEGKTRNEVMAEFFSYLSEAMTPEPAYISVDLFGFVMEYHNGLSIGQRLEDTVDVIDYISPMMYPSHYPSGHLNLANPAAHPGAVIAYGMEQGIPYFEGKRAMVRPWLQAFHMGAQYGATNIRAQIDEVEKHPNAGWLLWNASNRYSDAGLKLAE